MVFCVLLSCFLRSQKELLYSLRKHEVIVANACHGDGDELALVRLHVSISLARRYVRYSSTS